MQGGFVFSDRRTSRTVCLDPLKSRLFGQLRFVKGGKGGGGPDAVMVFGPMGRAGLVKEIRKPLGIRRCAKDQHFTESFTRLILVKTTGPIFISWCCNWSSKLAVRLVLVVGQDSPVFAVSQRKEVDWETRKNIRSRSQRFLN